MSKNYKNNEERSIKIFYCYQNVLLHPDLNKYNKIEPPKNIFSISYPYLPKPITKLKILFILETLFHLIYDNGIRHLILFHCHWFRFCFCPLKFISFRF